MVGWLFGSGSCVVEHDFAEHGRMDFRRGPVAAYLEETQVLPGIWLYRADAGGPSRFNIAVEGGPTGHGRLIMGTMMAGRGAVTLEGCDEQSWREEGRAYMLSPIERRVRYDISADRGWRCIAVRLEAEALAVLGADGGLPGLVRDVLEGRRDDLTATAPVSGALRTVSQLLLRSPYVGNMQLLFRQAKVLEMLTYLFDRLDSDDGCDSLTASEVNRVRRAHGRLLTDLRDPPDLERLALEVGLPAKRLNRGFRMLYGTTVFNYLRDARLDAARAALEDGSPLTLKQLAWELGYGQVTNFVTAFRRRFGVPPGAYRRQDG